MVARNISTVLYIMHQANHDGQPCDQPAHSCINRPYSKRSFAREHYARLAEKTGVAGFAVTTANGCWYRAGFREACSPWTRYKMLSSCAFCARMAHEACTLQAQSKVSYAVAYHLVATRGHACRQKASEPACVYLPDAGGLHQSCCHAIPCGAPENGFHPHD